MNKKKPTEEQKTIFHYIHKRNENLLIEARAGCGKCLGKDTPVLMFDGSIKRVQDINVGDKLMGDDGIERNVLSTNVGYGELYEIYPTKGDSWVCNDVHIMTLHHDKKKKLVDISINNLNSHKRYENGNLRNYRLQRIGVEFKEEKNNIDPYLIGLWLGDGNKRNGSPILTINENHHKVIKYLKKIVYKNIITKVKKYYNIGCYRVSLTTPNHSGKKNVLKEEFKTCIDKHNNKIIAKKYLINSKQNRLKLLAGLLDSDGYINQNGKVCSITTKYDTLKEDILFLCRSLGFAAYASIKRGVIKKSNFVGNYWRISISGSFEEIPLKSIDSFEKRKQIKNVLRTGFKYESIGLGNYYGFTLDGNGRFLLGDFTITHNSSTIIAALPLIPKDKDILFLAFNKHIQEELKGKLPDYVRCKTIHGLW